MTVLQLMAVFRLLKALPLDVCFRMVADVIDRVPKLGNIADYAKQVIRDKLIDHHISPSTVRTCLRYAIGSGRRVIGDVSV